MLGNPEDIFTLKGVDHYNLLALKIVKKKKKKSESTNHFLYKRVKYPLYLFNKGFTNRNNGIKMIFIISIISISIFFSLVFINKINI